MNWGRKPLGEVCEIISGATPRSSVKNYWDGNVAWATPKDLSSNKEKHLADTRRKVTEEGLASCSAVLLPPGSVLFSSRAPIGLVAINTIPMATNQGFKSFIPSNEIDANYLYWWLKANRLQINSKGRGATFKEVSKTIVSELNIPLPLGPDSLTEQRRIAAILDKADAIRRKRQKALDLTDTFLRSTFLHMFGAPGSAHWKMTTVEKVALQEKGSIRTGPFGSQLLTSEFVDSGITVLGIDNAVTNEFTPGKSRFITEDKYQELKRYTVKAGDVLITIMGTCGKCAIVPENHPPAINTKHLCCITLDQNICLPEFLHSYFLMHPIALSYLGKTAKGAIMNGLNMGIIKDLPIPLPPIELQLKYSNIVKQLNKTNGSLKANITKAKNLFSALQQKAFKGELGDSHQISLPSAPRKKQVNTEGYLTALIHSYINLQNDAATIKELATTLTVLAAKENFTDSYNRHLGQDAQQWLESCNDAVALENVLSVLRRMTQHQWIEVSPQGRIQSLANFKTPKDLVWPMYDMQATLRILSEADSVTDFQSLDIIDLSSIQKQA